MTLKELRRQYHCAAYNTLVAIISCTQKDIKFYTGFLFTENPLKVVVCSMESLVYKCLTNLLLQTFGNKNFAKRIDVGNIMTSQIHKKFHCLIYSTFC